MVENRLKQSFFWLGVKGLNYFQDEECDNDREDGIAEGFKPGGLFVVRLVLHEMKSLKICAPISASPVLPGLKY